MSPIRVCVLQLPALLRRDSGVALPSSRAASSSAVVDPLAVLQRKQQQMQRVREALVGAVTALRQRGEKDSSAFTTTFEPETFSAAAVPTSYKAILDALLASPAFSAAEGVRAAPFELLVLPEIWNAPYHNSCFGAYAEHIPDVPLSPSPQDPEEAGAGVGATEGGGEAALTASPSFAFMRDLAKRLRVYVVGGSIVERSATKKRPLEGRDGGEAEEKVALYNTCCVFDCDGAFIAKHRKMHLFDISILKSDDPNGKGIIFRESDTLSSGNSLTSFSLPSFGNVGVGICYDLRFSEMALALTQQRQCKLLCYPGAFNQTTGPPHWSLLLRGRALDNQVYVVGCSPSAPAVSGEGEYPAYGHSIVVSPYGDVLAELDGAPGAIFASIEKGKVDLFRKQVPTSVQKRFGEVYTQVQEIAAEGLNGAAREGTPGA
ncbi:hydrolase, carbon-nitrogen family protein [Besnoitia besnoiti]|uniref:Hydrolase, carbon-nitrogen family protein n=1 Tax=Besnoitia besnoiti TaxID=94643 RepID=A0A2A9MFJ2_BESBE|nr:hydrolase, carbon-nitrogen family protein [Besnoitia besnoiti]PFH36699.1 hydrolase, carbon-nitrogen family protein [Besnoitia besnoiti]